MDIEEIQNEIIKRQVEYIDKQLMDFFTPYLRSVGIKGEITKGKIKWRGIKMKVEYQLDKHLYQLNQRGVDISPIFEILISKNELNKSSSSGYYSFYTGDYSNMKFVFSYPIDKTIILQSEDVE